MRVADDGSRLAARLEQVADNLAGGRRETPQRFIPVARFATEDARRRLALVRFLVADALAEAADEGEHSAAALALLARTAAAVGMDGEPDLVALRGLEGDVLALAPRIGRRRSIHCHGWIAADRRLLLARDPRRRQGVGQARRRVVHAVARRVLRGVGLQRGLLRDAGAARRASCAAFGRLDRRGVPHFGPPGGRAENLRRACLKRGRGGAEAPLPVEFRPHPSARPCAQ